VNAAVVNAPMRDVWRMRESVMQHEHIAVICVQTRNDERTERFVVFSSALPLDDRRGWPEGMPTDMACTGLISEDEVRSELAARGLSAEGIDARAMKRPSVYTTHLQRLLAGATTQLPSRSSIA
jgi:7-keto-8-aminopelargonate synthetase-like enzyme